MQIYLQPIETHRSFEKVSRTRRRTTSTRYTVFKALSVRLVVVVPRTRLAINEEVRESTTWIFLIVVVIEDDSSDNDDDEGDRLTVGS